MEGIRRFFSQAFMSYKSLFAMLSFQNYILVKTLMPLFQMIFFILTAKLAYQTTDLTPWIIGNSLILASFNAFFGVGNNFITDRAMGTLKVIIASPINKFVIFVGRTLMHIIDGLFTVILGLVVGVILFDMDLTHIHFPLFILTLFIGVFSVMSLGILIGIFALVTREIHMLLNIAYSLMLLFSGANIPKENLPNVLSFIPVIMPLTRSIEAAKMIYNDNLNVGMLLLEEFILGFIFIGVALIFYNHLEKRARHGSTIDVY